MLINTKLQPPLLRSRLLYRKHLVQRLESAREYPLTQIIGPGGSGKTSLICQWIKNERMKVAWYSLDEEDNEADLFFRYLLTALTHMDKGLDQALRKVLLIKQDLAEKNVIPHIIASLSTLSKNICLVLDDFHKITNGKIHTALIHLIQYIPSRLNLVIASRYRLPAPMDAVAIKKERLEISASELKFTDAETADLFRKVIPLRFSPKQIHDLNRHAEGWAAGLQLIGLSVMSKGNGHDLSYILNQAHEQVSSYLIHDILHMQSEKVRDFVFATALFDRFNSNLCAEITAMPDVERILAHLDRMNLFLIPLDTGRKWYRYHHMFSKVVRRQVAIDTPHLVSETLRSAATWFAKNNYLEDALRCAFKSNDIEFTADLMEDHIHQYFDRHAPTAGLRWILRLPESVLRMRGLLRLRQCAFLMLLWEYDEIKQILFELEGEDSPAFKGYSGRKLEFCREYFSHFNCIIQIVHPRETVDVVTLLELKDKLSQQTPTLYGAIEMLVGFIFILKGELSLAEQSFANVSNLNGRPKDSRIKLFIIKARSLIARHQGRLYEAEAILNEVLLSQKNKEKGAVPTASFSHRHFAYIFYLRNKLEKAREHLEISFHQDAHDEFFYEIMAGYELQLMLQLAANETENAKKQIKKIKAISVKYEKPQMIAGANMIEAKLAIEQGNPAIAERWSQQRKFKLDEPFSLLFVAEGMTFARLQHACKKYSDAYNILEILRNRCKKRELMELVFQIDILRCAVLYALGRRETAESLLLQTLAFSETEGYVRPYVDDVALIATILTDISEKLSGTSISSHFKTVLTACKIPLGRPGASHKHGSGRYGVLTRRELDILRWMAKGAKNKEIAHHTFISLNTVKSHVGQILSKLGVNSRTQAILIAKDMKLL